MKSKFAAWCLSRLHFTFNVFLAALLLAIIVFSAAKIDHTFTFNNRPQTISMRATSMLEKLEGTIRCIVILPRNNLFYNQLRQLLLNMQSAAVNANLELEFLDPHIDLSRASDVVRRYGADGWCIIFEKGNSQEIVSFDDLIERTSVDSDTLLPGSVINTRFRGEQQCVTALVRLANPHSPILYALTGHGERDFHNYDKFAGYSDLAREIRREGYQLKNLPLASNEEIPSDCDLLIIAGPKHAPQPFESNAILTYLSRGGRLLFLIDRQDKIPSGWEDISERIGVRFANLTAITEGTFGGYNLSIDFFGDHPISRDLAKNSISLSSPQVLEINDDAVSKFRLKTDIVVLAPSRAWGETTPEQLPRIYNPGIDRKGILPLAIASEVPGGDDLALKLMRAFIVGDSNMGANAFLGGGNTANRDILLNAIGWLTDSDMPSAPSIEAEGNSLRLNLSLRRQIRFWTNGVFLWPLSVCLIGVLIALAKRLFD